jgi:mono/diheme cytochrome c family protein
MKMFRTTFINLVLIAVFGFMAGIPAWADDSSNNQSQVSQDQVMAIATQLWNGPTQYQMHCSGCHGYWGQGITIYGPPLQGDPFVVHGSVAIIAQTIEQGRQGAFKHYRAYSGMPRFNQLSVGEIYSIVNYLQNGLQSATPESGLSANRTAIPSGDPP